MGDSILPYLGLVVGQDSKCRQGKLWARAVGTLAQIACRLVLSSLFATVVTIDSGKAGFSFAFFTLKGFDTGPQRLNNEAGTTLNIIITLELVLTKP